MQARGRQGEDVVKQQGGASAQRAGSVPAQQTAVSVGGGSHGLTPGAVRTFQRSLGNTRTSQVLRGGSPAVQRAWEGADRPQPVSLGFSTGVQPADAERLARAVGMIAAAVDKAKEQKKQVLLYLGVGTGNPMGAWGHPSGGATGSITDEHQRNPGFLAHAQESDYFVVAANFNQRDGDITEHATEGSLRIDVPARFPLTAADRKSVEGPMDQLQGLAKGVERFAVMNAVTNADYEHLVQLVESRTKAKSSSAYLKSYMENGTTEARNPMNKRMNVVNAKPNNFARMGDVFVQDSEK